MVQKLHNLYGVYFLLWIFFLLSLVAVVTGQLWPEYSEFPTYAESMPGYIPPQPSLTQFNEFFPPYSQEPEQLFGFPRHRFENTQKSSPDDGLSRILINLATKLPEIADKMAKVIPLTAAPPKLKAGFQLFPVRTTTERAIFGVKNVRPEEEPVDSFPRNFERAGGMGLFFSTEPSVKGDKIAEVINSMPDPSSLFSFNNLFSQLSGKNKQPKDTFAILPSEEEEDKIYDMRLIHGTPIEKEEDAEPETYDKEEYAQVNEKPEVVSEIPLSKEVKSAKPSSVTDPEPENTTKPLIDLGNNIWGKILSGNADKIDWLGTFLPDGKDGSEGNALSSLLKGGIFGSAMDDGKIKNKDKNFRFH